MLFMWIGLLTGLIFYNTKSEDHFMLFAGIFGMFVGLIFDVVAIILPYFKNNALRLF